MLDPDAARDYFEAVVARVDAAPDDPYWAHVFLTFVLKGAQMELHRLRIVRAFLAWAERDPRWFALETGALDAIPGILAKLMERGRNVEYLGNDFGMRLPRALVEHGVHLGPCISFLEMVHAQTPRNDVAMLIEKAKAAEGHVVR